MGMDLSAKNGTAMRYNWTGWNWLVDFLKSRKVDTTEFSYVNDGELISEEVCKEVASAIEAGSEDYNQAFGGEPVERGGYGMRPASDHAKWWKESGGVEQF